jgi:hypothetical protein
MVRGIKPWWVASCATNAPFDPSARQPRAHYRQVGERQHRERGVAIPSLVLTHLIVIQPYLAFGGLQALLNRPAPSRNRHQYLHTRARRGEGEIIGQLFVVVSRIERSPDEQRQLKAGEHCSVELQGFMEGAAREGARAAQEVAQAMR